MVGTNWGGVFFGALFVAMGLALFFSRRFAEWSFKFDYLGYLWTKALGEKGALFLAKYVFSVLSLILGGLVLLGSINTR
jgi:hypothetical protein